MNLKVMFADFIVEIQLIEEYLKIVVVLSSNKIKKCLKHQNITYKIDKKKLNKLNLGGLICELKKYIKNETIIENLNTLRGKRNELVHKHVLTLLEQTNNLRISEKEKDKILNDKLSEQIKKASILIDRCSKDLKKLIEEI